MNCLIVPTLALDTTLIERLARSIDYPVKHKLAINNGPFGALNEFRANHPDWIVMGNGRNHGVAASWNMAPQLWPHEQSWMLVNDDVEFHPGALQRFCEESDRLRTTCPIVFLNDTEPFYAFVWTQLGRENVGLWDENFWPAYYEDSDMRIRLRLSGYAPVNVFGKDCPVNHGKPQVGGMNYGAMIQGCGLFGREYFLRKWGIVSNDGSTKFSAPFNRDRVKDWWLNEDRLNRIRPLWETFMAMPNPSIYT